MFKCRLRVIFAEREIKQKDFAEKIGISGASVSAIVRGKQIPTLEVAYRIAEELQMPIEQIWVRVEE
jgi:DNA-binding XRE family transcriptional regulator